MRRVQALSNAAQGFSAMLAPKYEGPYEITAKLAPTVYLLEMEGSRWNIKVHVGKLKRYLQPRRVINGFWKNRPAIKGVDWKHAGVFGPSPFSPPVRVISWLVS